MKRIPLIDERPIILEPTLIAVFGFADAAIIQQIHWLLNLPKGGRIYQGEKWIWGTYEEWCQDFFPWWQPRTLRKRINELEKKGLIISCQMEKRSWNRTKFYRLDYDLLAKLITDHAPSMWPKQATSTGSEDAGSSTEITTEGKGEKENPFLFPPKKPSPPLSKSPIIPSSLERQLVDALLEVTGKLALADAGDDYVLCSAHKDVGVLWNLGVKHPDNIHEIAALWKKEDWRGQRGDLPTNHQFLVIAQSWIKTHYAQNKPPEKRYILDPITGEKREVLV